ncbi:hypothetical protein LIX17_26130 (plasmid) [Mycobacterium avium subsp. hominissuis]|uniref:hypothetical protein n=1 Tax=Mycobacterium avium TaxID=1764 RepID=UPI00313FEC46
MTTRYVVTQTTTTIRTVSYTEAEVRALIGALHGPHWSCSDEDLGTELHAAVLDATDITDRVVADLHTVSETSEYEIHTSKTVS